MAQEASGRVIGVVTDPSGSVIPRAKVTVTNVDTNVSNETTAEPDGGYQILLLPVGSYRVSAEAPGFRKTLTSAQKLEINQSVKIDVKLEVGTTSETVQVEANGSGVETVVAHARFGGVRQPDFGSAPGRTQRDGFGHAAAWRNSGRGWRRGNSRQDEHSRRLSASLQLASLRPSLTLVPESDKTPGSLSNS